MEHVGHVGGDVLPQFAVHHDEEDTLEKLELIEEKDENSWEETDQLVAVVGTEFTPMIGIERPEISKRGITENLNTKFILPSSVPAPAQLD